jgi:hypothetical protein
MLNRSSEMYIFVWDYSFLGIKVNVSKQANLRLWAMIPVVQ